MRYVRPTPPQSPSEYNIYDFISPGHSNRASSCVPCASGKKSASRPFTRCHWARTTSLATSATQNYQAASTSRPNCSAPGGRRPRRSSANRRKRTTSVGTSRMKRERAARECGILKELKCVPSRLSYFFVGLWGHVTGLA